MKTVPRFVVSGLSLGALGLALVTSPALPARASTVNLERGPYSTGVLLAHAIATGKVVGQAPRVGGLTCTPAPCTFPNVQASGGTMPVNEDPIAANPANPMQLLTGGNDYNCPAIQGYYASSNGGSTWTRTCGTTLSGMIGLGDPIVAYSTTGTAFRGGIDGNSSATVGVIVVDKSTNNGTTWSAPVQAVPNTLGGLADKPWMEIDTTAASPHANNIYISATQFATSNNSQISLSRSSNGGTTWATVAVDSVQSYPNIDQFSDLAVGKDGTLYVSWMRCNAAAGNCAGTTATMVLSKSTDGGVTFSAPVTIAKAKLAPGPCGAFYGCLPNTNERVSDIPVIAVDNSTTATANNLYVTDYTWTGAYMKVQVMKSTNGGATWSSGKRVTPATDTHDQFLPWINVSGTGVIGVTWLDRRNDPANLSYDAYGAASKNGGASYPNKKLSTAMSNPNNDGFSGSFMGDYTGNSWAGSSLYVSWMDSRGGSVMQDEVGGLRP